MCRHFLPHLDIPVGRVLHSVGHTVGAHSMPVAAAVVSFVAMASILAARRWAASTGRRRLALLIRPSRPEPIPRGGELGPAQLS